jgi:hypothetical protein
MAMIPSANPTSPTRLTMNAFLAASAAERLRYQNPICEDQQQHREHEQVEVGEEAPVPRVVAHVADGVDVDEQADRRDDDEQARRQGIDEEADLHHEAAGRDPGEPVQRVAVRLFRPLEQWRRAR